MLEAAVESAMLQRMSAARYEIVVIDSASTDETQDVLRSLSLRWGERLRWDRTDQLGLSLARNRGLELARGEIVAFMDADAVAGPGWLDALLRVFADHPKAGVVGGAVCVLWDHPKPAWWRDCLDEVFNSYNPSNARVRLQYPKFPYGTNMAVRARAARDVGGFALSLGRQGRALMAGEDGELCLRLEHLGWEIWFSPAPDSVVHHRTKPERMSRRYILRRAIRHGRSQRQIERMHGVMSGIYPSWTRLLLLCASRVLTGTCDLGFLKFASFRFGYRLEESRRIVVPHGVSRGTSLKERVSQ